MTMPHTHSAWTKHLIVRACLKAALLWLVFYGAYAVLQPVATGRLPSLYAVLGVGRVRLLTDIEPNLFLLLNDHEIQQAQAEMWNMMMLGSSETYGLYDVPDNAMPRLLDRAGLQTDDGRRVRVYNLSYVIPDAAKDLLIADAVLQAGVPIDLIVLNVNAWAFTPLASHTLLMTNPAATFDLIERYDLAVSAYADLLAASPYGFWEDRSTLHAWTRGQVDLVRWSILRVDNRGNGPQKKLGIETGVNPMLPITRGDLLRAFRQLRDTYDVPVLLISVPRTYSQDDFLPWLYIESATNGLPLLDCEFIFDDMALFLDSIHLKPETDPLYARILAQHFSRPEMSAVTPHMPLRLPGDFVPPEENCVFLPNSP